MRVSFLNLFVLYWSVAGQLTVLEWFQVDSEGTQSSIHMDCVSLLEVWFCLGICPGVGLLNLMVVLVF